MITSLLAVIHVVVCIFLMLVILIQDPKGGGGGLFGGGASSNSILSSTGANDLISTITKYTALAFGVLCIGLTIATKPSGKGVFDKLPQQAVTEGAAATTVQDAVETTEKVEAKSEESASEAKE